MSPGEFSLSRRTNTYVNDPVKSVRLGDITRRATPSPPNVFCPAISIANGQFSVLGHNYILGSPIPNFAFLVFTCNDHFTLYPANARIQCVNGAWNNLIPQCIPTCPPIVSSSMHVACTLYGQPVDCNKPLIEDTEARSKCKQFYTTAINEIPVSISRCSGGSWDNPLITCVPDCGKLVSDGITYIVNGQDAKKGEFPWHIALYHLQDEKHVFKCGGSIISQLIVLTAAHCFTDISGKTRYPAQEYYVAAGKYYSDYNSAADIYAQNRQVREYHIPSEFTGSETNFAGDLAVVVVDNPFEMTNLVQPVCMDWLNEFESQQLVPNNTGRVVGWGHVDPEIKEPSETLKQLDAPYIDKTKCINEFPLDYRPQVTPDKFCAGFRNGSSVCHGDSGSGLVFKWYTNKFYLRGLVSGGPLEKRSCNNFHYATYTRISIYKDFILNIRSLNQVKD